MRLIPAILILTFYFMFESFGKEIDVPIVPAPQVTRITDGGYQLPQNVRLLISSSAADELDFSAELIKNSFQKYFNLDVSITKSRKHPADITLELISQTEDDSALALTKNKEEGYHLWIGEKGIRIRALTPKGILYGTMSLLQLTEKTKDGKIQGLEIIDWPDMKIRGISDDISRGQVSKLENFKKIISHLARYKMNTYMLYIEDVMRFDNYPSIGINRGALTKDEIREIVAFAKKHFIDVIPIFQTLGHYENILSQEEFLQYAEFPGAASLCVACDSTYIFLENLLKEVFEVFPSEYFHMGADESWDVGLGKSRALVDASDIAAVHANHYKNVYQICKKYNKKIMMYGDIILQHPEILSQIPKDIIIVDWHYRAQDFYPSTEKFKSAGFTYLVSPSVWNFLTTFPTHINSLPNIRYIISSGVQNDAVGMINSNWGDYGAETFKELVLYGYAWSAQCSWSLEKSTLNIFSRIYFYDFFGIDDPRSAIIYESLSNTLNQMLWHDVWRHPLLPFREPNWWEPKISPVGRISWMELTLPQTMKNITDLEKLVVKNKEHFQILNFLVELNLWYKLKINTQFELASLLNEKVIDKSKAIKLIDKNIEKLKSLKSKYKSIWLQYYKEDNLNMIEDKFDRLTAYFEEAKQALTDNNLTSPLISSKWIYVRDDDSEFVSSASFSKDFQLPEKPQKAYLQLMGDTYARLYINGEFVDKVFARRSLSLLVDYKRIKFIDITPLLKKGKNTIEVVTENFNTPQKNKGNYKTGSGAGFNLCAEITLRKEHIKIESDETWESMFDGINSRRVVSKKYPFDVIAPNFRTERTSWIER